MRMKKIILIVHIIFIISNVKAQSVETFKDSNKKLFLKFQFIQTNFYSDKYCKLSDSLDWQNYDGKKVPAKSTDSKKMYVFKSYFYLSDSLQNVDLSIFVGSVSFPSYIYLNQKLIGRLGSYKEIYTSLIYPFHEYILSHELLNYGKDSVNEIQIQAYPKYNETFPLDRIYISSFKIVSSYTFWRNFVGIRFAQAAVFFTIILFLYFFVGYFMKRDRSDLKYLYFAFFCLFFSMCYINMTLAYDIRPQLWLSKISRIGLSVSNLFIVLFTMAFTGILNKSKILKLILVIPTLIFVVAILAQNNVQEVENVLGIFVGYVSPPYVLFAFIISLISSIKKPKPRNIFFTVGYTLFLATIIVDAINYTSLILPYAWYIQHGYTIFIITIFFVLAGEQTDIYHLSLDRAIELEEIKNNLEIKVIQRTAEIEHQKEEIQTIADNLQEKNNLLNEQKEEINQQKEEIQTIADNLQTQNETILQMNEELSVVNKDISVKNKKITDSIQYALKIQTASTPPLNIVIQLFPQHFIIFKPRDIVSGDFYFIKKINNTKLIAAADCTGHGVPGAFLSMLVQTLLNEIVRKIEIANSSSVLNELREQIKMSLNQTGAKGERQDGLDIAFCAINSETLEMSYAGAHNPLYLIRNYELGIMNYELGIENKNDENQFLIPNSQFLIPNSQFLIPNSQFLIPNSQFLIPNSQFLIFEADKQPVGIYIKEKPFTEHKIQLNVGDIFYIFSDGYQSQLGGEKNLPFKTKYFKQVLTETCCLTMDEQKQFLETKFKTWKANHEQTDDVLVIGIKI